MKVVVASLKRLYTSGKISKEVVKARVVKGTINEEEYKVITGEEYSAEDTTTDTTSEENA